MKPIPILCYHKVGRGSEEGKFLNVEPVTLEKHVAFFARRREFLKVSDLADRWHDRAVCFTFDDAYQSAVLDAAPVLGRYGCAATFFAVAGLVGASSAWDNERAKHLASWKELLELQKAGHEVGNHTHSHARLASLPFAEQLSEITNAHSLLVQNGIQSRSICYPYGSHNDDTISAAEQAGYAVGVILNKKRATSSDSKLRLPRIVVAYSDGITKLLYKIYVRPLLP